MKKKYLIEIILILAISVVLALIYNWQNPKGLSLIYKPVKLVTIDDKELFGDVKKDSAKTNTNFPVDTIKQNTQTPQKDTLSEKKDDDLSKLNKTVTYSQVLKIIKSSQFIIIDARNAENYAESRIGNSINIFPYDSQDKLFAEIQKLPRDKKILVYCDGGDCESSHKLAEYLDMFGYNDVYIYSGGWEDWIKNRRKK